MEYTNEGQFLVARDEARLFKRGAWMNADRNLSRIFGHYLAIRQTAASNTSVLRSMLDQDDEIMNETANLSALVIRSKETAAVQDMRYVYGPLLAAAAVGSLMSAIDKRAFCDREVMNAQYLVDQYTAIDLVCRN